MLELPHPELALPEDLGVLGIELEATRAIQSLRGAVIHLQTPPGQSHGYLLAELKLEQGQPGPRTAHRVSGLGLRFALQPNQQVLQVSPSK